MATKTITIPDEFIPDLLEAFADKYHYQDEIEINDPENPDRLITVPNPQTKGEFMMAMIMSNIKNIYIRYKMKVDADAAASVANTTATTESDNFTGA